MFSVLFFSFRTLHDFLLEGWKQASVNSGLLKNQRAVLEVLERNWGLRTQQGNGKLNKYPVVITSVILALTSS